MSRTAAARSSGGSAAREGSASARSIDARRRDAAVVPHAVRHDPPRESKPERGHRREAGDEQRLDPDREGRVHHATRTGWRNETCGRCAERSWRARNDFMTESMISSMSVVGAKPTRLRSFVVSGMRRGMSW